MTERPWFENPRYIPASNLVFLRDSYMATRAANGTILSYFVTHHPRAFGGKFPISYSDTYIPRPWVRKPIVYQSHSPGVIAAAGQTKDGMLGVKFPKRKNVVVLETIGKGGGKYPVGEYPIENRDVRKLDWDDTLASPLSPCCIRHHKNDFELVTVHPTGSLVCLTYDGTTRSARFGPDRIAAFELFYSDNSPERGRGAYIIREPQKWIIKSTDETQPTREMECSELAPDMAFIGFPTGIQDFYYGQIAVPMGQAVWGLPGQKGDFAFKMSPDMTVVGVTAHGADDGPAFVILEKDQRNITLIGPGGFHHFPPAAADIVQIKTHAFDDVIVYVTKLGEMVALNKRYPKQLILLSPRVTA